MLQMGLEITVVEYINAHKWRQKIKNAFLKAMADYDALLVPTTILSAPLLDQKMVCSMETISKYIRHCLLL